jgi:hypothetical protein
MQVVWKRARRPALVSAIAMLLVAAGQPAYVSDGDWSATGAVGTVVAVERAMAEDEAEAFEEIASLRLTSARALNELYQELDTAVREAAGGPPEGLLEVLGRVEAAEREREAILARQRATARRIADHLQRAEMLEARATTLREQERAEAGPLTGQWEVVLLPQEQRGAFNLVQTGTIVTGTYRMEGGWTGSLQGTLVNRKVYLVRIDSQLGRSMEFEGRLVEDDTTIRGSWLNYELAGQGGGQGQWTATRVGQ